MSAEALKEIREAVLAQGLRARAASRLVVSTTAEQRNKALRQAAAALRKRSEDIIFKNEIDLEAARESKLPAALIDRLRLDAGGVEQMAKGLEEIAALPDPLGEIIEERTRPNGLKIQKIRVPIGVIGMIYESRPNVTVEASGLCLKAGNAIILRGGREAADSNAVLAKIMDEAVVESGLPAGAIQALSSLDRRSIHELIQLQGIVDLIVARGSEEMIREVAGEARVPVLGHGKGTCHIYVDESADVEQAARLALNAKVQRPGVCNAMESLLVHEKVAERLLPGLSEKLKAARVEIRADEKARRWIPGARAAREEDWSTEYLDLILSIRVVPSVEEAIQHINRHGSGHTDSIVTRDEARAEKFLREVDSACVMVNASTRLHDGGVFGFGAEIGISTGKLHARGTMGLRELTSSKYVVRGSGQIRD